MTRYRWVASRKAEGFPTTRACAVAGVSCQGFYDWCRRVRRGPGSKELAEQSLVGEIRAIHADSGGAYGSLRVTAELRRQGRHVNHKRVERLMRINGICGIYKRRKPRWRGSGGLQVPADLVRRDFGPGRVDSVWVGDITYINTDQGWLHLVVVLDLGSRRAIDYSMANHTRTQIVVDALNTAAATRGHHTTGLVFHSDRGSQYLSAEFAATLTRRGIQHSVRRVGNCSDNSITEAFFASPKRKLITQMRFITRNQARQAVFAWIGRYNTHRIHPTLNNQTPTQWKNNQQTQLTQAAQTNCQTNKGKPTTTSTRR